MVKGKCVDCKLAYKWKGKPLLRDAKCRCCGKPLKATVWYLGSGKNRDGWKWVDVNPLSKLEG